MATRSPPHVFRVLEIFAKRPTNASTLDLTGKFGRVYVGTTLFATGFRAIESEQNVLEFDGAGTAVSREATRYTVERNANGAVNTLVETAPEELGISYQAYADGSTNLGNGSLNDTFDFFAMSDMEETDDGIATDEWVASVDHSLTLGVKLPADILTISDKVYRVMGVETAYEGDGEIAVHTTRFASLLTMTSQTSASMDATLSDLILAGGSSDLVVEKETVEDVAMTVEVLSGGATTFSMNDGGGVFTMQGFLNEDGSLGIMQTRYTPTGGQPNALGVAVLVEVDPG